MISLSFDTDHMDEARMGEFLSTVRVPGAATFFCTERYTGLGAPHEACPHPTLEPGGDWDRALDAARELFPEAEGVRPHGCLAGHALSLELAGRGYRYLSSQDSFGRAVGPFREAWGVWQVPIYYMETLDLAYARHWPDGQSHRPFSEELIERAVGGDGVCVFDFHPIHLLLNSESVDGYTERRRAWLGGAALDEARNPGAGARTFYDRLVDEMEAAGIASVPLGELVRQASGSAVGT